MTYEVRRGDYLVSDDRNILDMDAIHAFLSRQSYWANGISRERLETAVDHSIPLGLFEGDKQIGFARAITDRATFAYLADVYVDEAYRGRGLSKLLIDAVLGHPEVQHLRRWMLGTRDAHDLYRQFGFIPLEEPLRWLELADPEAYTRLP